MCSLSSLEQIKQLSDCLLPGVGEEPLFIIEVETVPVISVISLTR
jgi:hypothetical protein